MEDLAIDIDIQPSATTTRHVSGAPTGGEHTSIPMGDNDAQPLLSAAMPQVQVASYGSLN